MHPSSGVATGEAPTPVQPVSVARWLRMVGADVLLLALLWREYLQPSSVPFALGNVLMLLVTLHAWVQLGRWLWRRHRVHKVFGDSVTHLQAAVLPWPYRLVGLVGDVLITATVLYTGNKMLALSFGTVALVLHGLQNRHLLSNRHHLA